MYQLNNRQILYPVRWSVSGTDHQREGTDLRTSLFCIIIMFPIFTINIIGNHIPKILDDDEKKSLVVSTLEQNKSGNMSAVVKMSKLRTGGAHLHQNNTISHQFNPISPQFGKIMHSQWKWEIFCPFHAKIVEKSLRCVAKFKMQIWNCSVPELEPEYQMGRRMLKVNNARLNWLIIFFCRNLSSLICEKFKFKIAVSSNLKCKVGPFFLIRPVQLHPSASFEFLMKINLEYLQIWRKYFEN